MKRKVIVLSMVLGLVFPGLFPGRAQAEPMRDFIMSCSYGVLAGTLVGAATLAFSDKPGDNLNKIARGASFGLYAGILLGTYVVYGVSDGATEDDVRALGQVSSVSKANDVRLLLSPLFSPVTSGVDGLEVRYDVVRF